MSTVRAIRRPRPIESSPRSSRSRATLRNAVMVPPSAIIQDRRKPERYQKRTQSPTNLPLQQWQKCHALRAVDEDFAGFSGKTLITRRCRWKRLKTTVGLIERYTRLGHA